MSTREIEDGQQTGDYPPLIGLREKGNYVKGKVTAITQTKNGNPAVTLTLIDLEGSTSRSEGKGKYVEVDVKVGDDVQVIGSVKQLRAKLPQLVVGDVATIKFTGKKKLEGGKSLNEFKVTVEE